MTAAVAESLAKANAEWIAKTTAEYRHQFWHRLYQEQFTEAREMMLKHLDEAQTDALWHGLRHGALETLQRYPNIEPSSLASYMLKHDEPYMVGDLATPMMEPQTAAAPAEPATGMVAATAPADEKANAEQSNFEIDAFLKFTDLANAAQKLAFFGAIVANDRETAKAIAMRAGLGEDEAAAWSASARLTDADEEHAAAYQAWKDGKFGEWQKARDAALDPEQKEREENERSAGLSADAACAKKPTLKSQSQIVSEAREDREKRAAKTEAAPASDLLPGNRGKKGKGKANLKVVPKAEPKAAEPEPKLGSALPLKVGPAYHSYGPKERITAQEKDAKKGVLPHEPDFSKETHARWRPLLAQVVKLVQAGDIAGLKRIKCEPISSSRNIIDRYRTLAIVALMEHDKK